MKLTETEKKTVRQGNPLPFQDDDLSCIVLRADLFEKFREQLPEQSLPAQVVTTLVEDAMTDYDAADPLLDSYQHYKS